MCWCRCYGNSIFPWTSYRSHTLEQISLKTWLNFGLELDILSVLSLYLSLSLSVRLCLSLCTFWPSFQTAALRRGCEKPVTCPSLLLKLSVDNNSLTEERLFFFFSLFFLGCPLVPLPLMSTYSPLPPHANTIWPRDLSEQGFSPLTWRLRRLSKSRSSNSKSPASNVWTLWCPNSPHSSWSVALR